MIGTARRGAVVGADWRPPRLSSPIGLLRPHYDVVVVGSGYGGAVVAARLARPGRRVCVLERGRELQPGDYPDTLAKALQEFQVDLPGRHLSSPTALYDLRIGPDLSVFVGCGLGGTSLINANVALRPDEGLLQKDPWPQAIQNEARPTGTRPGQLWDRFKRAERELAAQGLPEPQTPLKLKTLKSVAAKLKAPAPERAPVAVRFPDKSDPEPACTSCGDCVSGCNYGAKRTLIENYLPLAHKRGADIFTEVKVRSVQPFGSKDDARRRWIVHFDRLGSGRDRFTSTPLFVTAHTVVLAAGALGSPEILMRSREKWDLRLSDSLGARFSGNGDMLAFSYNNRERVNAIGFGTAPPRGPDLPGPCISGHFPLWSPAKDTAKPGLNARVEDGVIPGALSPILSLGFMLARFSEGGASSGSRGPRGLSIWRALEDALRGGTKSTQTFLAMVEDSGYGKLVWGDDRIQVRWSGAGSSDPYRHLEQLLRGATEELDGSYIPSPFGPVTVHPLGGCVMGDDPDKGVVSDTGAVFDADSRGVHPGLYVCDASIIPVALLTNPLLTITALADRAAESIGAQLP
jgi:cholesterol oxidase